MESKETEVFTPSGTLKVAKILRSKTGPPRSQSPPIDVDELMQSKRMHSFTRRIKSFNKDRNPDLKKELPSYMRQTCASLIKRPHMIPTPESQSRPARRTRTMSMDVTDGVSYKPRRRVRSSLSKMRDASVNFQSNDKLGYMLEGMPSGRDMSFGNNEAGRNSTHCRHRRTSSKQSLHSVASSIRQKANQRKTAKAQESHVDGEMPRVKSMKTVTVHGTRNTSEDSELSSVRSKSTSRRLSRSLASSDQPSDMANNTSPKANFDLSTVQIGVEGELLGHTETLGGERCLRPMSTLPLKEMDMAAYNMAKLRKPPRIRTRSLSHSLTPKCRTPQPTRSIPEEELMLPRRHSCFDQEIPLDTSSVEDSLFSDRETQEGPSLILVESQDAPSLTTLETSCYEVIEEKEEEQELSDDWNSLTYTAGAARTIFENLARQQSPLVLEESNDMQLSRDVDSEREIENLADIVPTKKSVLKKFKVSRRPSGSIKGDASKSPKPKLLRRLSSHLPPLAMRLQCFSFKACFCGADVSPGPEDNDDVDNHEDE